MRTKKSLAAKGYKRLATEVAPETVEALRQKAEACRASVSEVMRDVLTEWANKQARKIKEAKS